jgi:pSer/pThr/pTyr-binding forkhead associated (FHA) protein
VKYSAKRQGATIYGIDAAHEALKNGKVGEPLSHTEEMSEKLHSVPVASFSEEKAEALLCGKVPHGLPLDIHISPEGVVQEYSLDGLDSFREVFSHSDPIQALNRMEQLCQDVMEHPDLMDEAWAIFAEDRIFWEETSQHWRYLMLLTESPAWTALPDSSPNETWSALFIAAMAADPDVEKALAAVVQRMEDKEFSVSELLYAIAAVRECYENGPQEESTPATVPPCAENTSEEEEYRPWEKNETIIPADVELAQTGSTAHTFEPEHVNRQGNVQPEQPMIPGIAPPPPPPSHGTEPAFAAIKPADPGTATTVLLKPETSVLDNTTPPGQDNVIKVDVAKIRIPRIVRLETQEMAYVDKAHFVIGSKAGAVDFLIQGNRVISRNHAAIVTRGSDYYIVDLNSRNGVFVENKRIPRGQETLIYVGDVFMLANEKFKLQW